MVEKIAKRILLGLSYSQNAKYLLSWLQPGGDSGIRTRDLQRDKLTS